MSLSPLEKATIDAIISLFETNRPAKYDAIANSASDAGGLSYGKHQASLTSGSLHKLVSRYCAADGAKHADDLRPYLAQMERKDASLNSNNDSLKSLMREAAKDPVMMKVQDDYFAEHYMGPALQEAARCGFETPLGCAIVYDSFVHGSWSTGANIKGKTIEKVGQPNAGNEKQWVAAYLRERRAWMSSRTDDVRLTVYRPDCFLKLIADDAWQLSLPLNVKIRDYTYVLTAWDFHDATMFGDPEFRVDPAEFGVLKPHRAAFPEGRDLHVQQLLFELGVIANQAHVDGQYGSGTANYVINFQRSRNLPPTGEVDTATYLQLCDAVRRKRTGGGTFVPLPRGERPASSNVLAGGGAVAGAGAAGAAVLGAGSDSNTSTTTAVTTQTTTAVTTTTTATATDTTTAASTGTTETTTTTATAPVTTTTTTTASVEAPPPRPMWPPSQRDMLLWGGLGLLLAMIVLMTLARRRTY